MKLRIKKSVSKFTYKEIPPSTSTSNTIVSPTAYTSHDDYVVIDNGNRKERRIAYKKGKGKRK